MGKPVVNLIGEDGRVSSALRQESVTYPVSWLNRV